MNHPVSFMQYLLVSCLPPWNFLDSGCISWYHRNGNWGAPPTTLLGEQV